MNNFHDNLIFYYKNLIRFQFQIIINHSLIISYLIIIRFNFALLFPTHLRFEFKDSSIIP